MGSYLTRSRAWVYIAFYDEYVGRHINTAAGLSMCYFIPMYIYGIRVNRIVESNCNHYLYNWHFWDKRNRMTHNMIMEHFEVHKEQLEDLVVELHEKGPSVFADLPVNEKKRPCTTNDFALIDEMCGLNEFLNNFMALHDMPETTKQRIRAHMHTYDGPLLEKEIALNDLKMSMFGNQR